MKVNRQRTTIFIIVLVIIVLVLMTVFNNNHIVDTSEFLINRPWEKEIRIGNSDYMRHYLYSATSFYEDLPWAVRVSYSIIHISGLALIVLLYILFWDMHNRKAEQRRRAELKEAYFVKLKDIVSSGKEISSDEVRQLLGITGNSVFKYSERLFLIDIFLELRMLVKIDEISILNMQNAVNAFGLREFMEERLISGKDREKMKVIQAIRLLHMDVPDSYVTRIINHRDRNLQKAARLYYILSNEEDPFKYMEGKNSEGSFLPWDMLETHQIFEDCMAINKKLPSFVPAMNHVDNNIMIEFLIKETAYWGSDREMDYLLKYIESDDEALKKAVLESVSYRKMSQVKENLKDIYYRQSENVKRAVLYTIFLISDSDESAFFRDAFDSTSSQLTKRMALYCLWKSGDSGRKVFSQLKDSAAANDIILFLHVENKIIEREAMSFQKIN